MFKKNTKKLNKNLFFTSNYMENINAIGINNSKSWKT